MKYLFLKLLNKGINLLHVFIQLFHTKRIKILMMHEIVDDKIVSNEFQISYDDFKSLVITLNDGGMVISMDKFYKCYSKKESNGEYVITFDDVYESIYHYAFPLLKANKIPFTLFVNLSLLGTSGYITTEQLIEMADNELCTVGSHGMHHAFFRNLTKEECAQEFFNSKVSLEKIIKKPVDFFAFPYGSLVAVSFRNIRQIKNFGYKMSFSTIPSGVWHSTLIKNWFIPRINVTKKLIEII